MLAQVAGGWKLVDVAMRSCGGCRGQKKDTEALDNWLEQGC